jgi:hypothetical protein
MTNTIIIPTFKSKFAVIEQMLSMVMSVTVVIWLKVKMVDIDHMPIRKAYYYWPLEFDNKINLLHLLLLKRAK